MAPIELGSQSVIVPGYLVSAGLLATGGLAYLAVRRGVRFLGAGLIGIMLLLLGCTYAWIAFSVPLSGSTAQVPVQLMVLNALLYVFTALGMHLPVFEDMTYELRVTNRQLKGAQIELHELAITDPLTWCHNRRFFDEVIGRELQRHLRYHIPLSLLFVDIDRFKAVNDSLGHEAGGLVLQDVAAFLKCNVREADYVFRWGGDKFLVLISCELEEAPKKRSGFEEHVSDSARSRRAAVRCRAERRLFRGLRRIRRYPGARAGGRRGDVPGQGGGEADTRDTGFGPCLHSALGLRNPTESRVSSQ